MNNSLFKFYNKLLEAMAALGLNFNAITQTCEELTAAGFVNINQKVLSMPIGQ
jgi:hypothetical protein